MRGGDEQHGVRSRSRKGKVRATERGCPPVGGATAPAPDYAAAAAGCLVRITGRSGFASAVRPVVLNPSRAQAGTDGPQVPRQRSATLAERRFPANPWCDCPGFWRWGRSGRAAWFASPHERAPLGGPAGCAGPVARRAGAALRRRPRGADDACPLAVTAAVKGRAAPWDRKGGVRRKRLRAGRRERSLAGRGLAHSLPAGS